MTAQPPAVVHGTMTARSHSTCPVAGSTRSHALARLAWSGRAVALPVAFAAPAADGQVDGAQPFLARQDRLNPGMCIMAT